MAWTRYQKFLAVMMVITGSINSLSTKWADTMDSKGSDGVVRNFGHPFLQVPIYIIYTLLLIIFIIFDIIMLLNNSNNNNSEAVVIQLHKI